MDEDQVTELLRRARTVVDGAQIPDDLRGPAFTAAVGLLAGGQPGVAAAPIQPADEQGQHGGGGQIVADPALLDKIASGLGVEGAKVRRVYEEEGGVPELIVKSSALPATKSEAAGEIAILVMAARQLGGVEDYTEASVLRDACKSYSKFDQANFGGHMGSLDNLVRTQGTGRSTKRKLTNPGVEKAAELVEKYSSGK